MHTAHLDWIFSLSPLCWTSVPTDPEEDSSPPGFSPAGLLATGQGNSAYLKAGISIVCYHMLGSRTKVQAKLKYFGQKSIWAKQKMSTPKFTLKYLERIGWHFVSTNYQQIGEYRRAGLVWPCPRNYTIASPISNFCSLSQGVAGNKYSWTYPSCPPCSKPNLKQVRMASMGDWDLLGLDIWHCRIGCSKNTTFLMFKGVMKS